MVTPILITIIKRGVSPTTMASKAVNRLSFTQQPSYSDSSSDDDDDDDDREFLSRKNQTTAILYEFLDSTAETDRSLPYRDMIRMRASFNECVRLEEDAADDQVWRRVLSRVVISYWAGEGWGLSP